MGVYGLDALFQTDSALGYCHCSGAKTVEAPHHFRLFRTLCEDGVNFPASALGRKRTMVGSRRRKNEEGHAAHGGVKTWPPTAA